MTGQAASAAILLASEGISASVISVVQPALAGQAVAEAGEQGVPVLTVYDGLPGVLGNPVLAAKATSHWSSPVRSLGFRRGTSGRLDELLAWAGLDSGSIARTAVALLTGAESLTDPPGAGAHG
jgi:transketolase C-terminal domain/subunit